MQADPSTALRVFRVEGTADDAAALVRDTAALQRAFGADIATDRVQIVEPTALAGIGLSAYLVEGEGVDAAAISPDAARLDAVKGPILLLLPRAVPPGTTLSPQAPLVHLGDYPLASARPGDGPIRTSSAEGLISGAPPQTTDPGTQRRTSGMVALAALAVALLVAFVVWFVAS